MGLDESAQAGNPITFGSSGSPPLTVRFAGSGSIPTHSGRMARRIVAAVSTQFVFVVNHLVTSIWESISRMKSTAVCSKVLDLLRTQSPLVALPASLEQRSADSAETVLATREGVSARSSTSRQSTPQESAFLFFPRSDAPKLSNAASRQQFLLALLEDCSFFRSPRTSLRACSGLFTPAGVDQARIELPIDLRNPAGGSADFQLTRAAITAKCANP